MSLAGVHFVSAANFYMLAQLIQFVKNFFQILLNFFEVVVVLPVEPFITQLLYDSILNSICQHFFASIYKFLFNSLSFVAALADSLHILPPQDPFVKRYS